MRPGFNRPSATVLAIILAGAAAAVMVNHAQSQDSQATLIAKEATEFTQAANARQVECLPFADKQDFEDARRGFVAALPGGLIKADDGRIVWSLNDYAFLDRDSPPTTVNASLWRQARLNRNNGLFRVTDRIYQVRGFDLSNMTIIEGDTGLIVIDPLISAETARAAIDLYYEHRPRKPVVAVIHSHSHVDHFGGVRGVIAGEDVKAGKVRIFAPEGFLAHAVSENVFAGNAMSRAQSICTGRSCPRANEDRWMPGSARRPRGEPSP